MEDFAFTEKGRAIVWKATRRQAQAGCPSSGMMEKNASASWHPSSQPTVPNDTRNMSFGRYGRVAARPSDILPCIEVHLIHGGGISKCSQMLFLHSIRPIIVHVRVLYHFVQYGRSKWFWWSTLCSVWMYDIVWCGDKYNGWSAKNLNMRWFC